MKTLITLITTSLILFSCTKEETAKALADNGIPSYVGEYHSMGMDTAVLTIRNDGMAKIRFAYKNVFALRCTFDSIHINSDNTILFNEYVVRENSGVVKVETAIGGGKISEGTLEFSVAISGGPAFSFKGVKKQ